jgi:Flp pilus assembly protein TadG
MQAIVRALFSPFTAATATVRRLAVRRDGAVAMLFGLAAIPVVIAAGMALDTTRAYLVKTRLAAALDAAALAVGSQATNQTSTQLTTALKNFFFDNYCKAVPSGTTVTQCTSTVATDYGISVQATSSITSATVTYTASATVPTTFMRLVGVNSLPVTVKAQTTKFPGMEVAVVLDNTGSMLCGENEGTASVCGAGEVTSDTDCTNTSDASRICTLRRASLDFIATLQGAITAPESIYMSIVPFVTTVNIGNNSVYGPSNTNFCGSSGGSCSNVTTDATSANFTDMRGNIMPVTPITGTTTSGSTTISSISAANIAPIQAGMYIYGPGIPSGATVSSVGSSSIVISSAATLTYTANSIAVGPPTSSVSTSTPFTDPTTFNTTGSWTNGSKTLTVASTTGVVTGMVITSGSTGIPTATATTVSTIAGTTITMSAAATATHGAGTGVTFSLAGSATSSSTTINSLKGSTASLNSIVVGMPISGTGIPTNAYVKSITGTPPTSITISAATTSTKAGDIITLTNFGGTTQTGSNTIDNVSFNNTSGQTIPTVGQIIVGNGIPANTTITAVTGTTAQFAAGTGTLTISQNATTPSNFSSSTCPAGISGSNCFNTEIDTFTPLTYDSTYNSASPAGSSTTANWGGCVVEPTSSDENLSGTGVLNAGTDPDTNEPTSGTKWYPFYWVNDNTNGWPSIHAQDTATEALASEQTSFNTNDGPNQGCPVPILPLTDLTTSNGLTALQTAVNSMWPRDSGGTQVHVGAIWGWRTIAPGGPFAANNGHPLSYSDANTLGWKKIMVLMTDGTEEAFAAPNMTGTGQLTDGKLGTTNASTAINTLGSRLATTCTNMANDGIIIYTIGLGSGGANNDQLQSCPANGGFFSAATTSNLDSVFQNIAASIIHLRLTE